MTITAKYPGTCTACNGTIRRGETIDWQKGRGARHATCPNVTAAESPAARVDGNCWTCGTAPGRFRNHGASAPVVCDSCHSTCDSCSRKCEHCGNWTESYCGTQRCMNCCPSCHGPMPRRYAMKGYQCDRCADREESPVLYA